MGIVVWTTSPKTEPSGTPRPDSIQALVGVLEIVPVSYEGAVRNGKIIQGQEVQYRGAQDALRRARALFREAQGTITARNPATARLVAETLRQIEEAITALRPPTEVRRLIERVTQALKDLDQKLRPSRLTRPRRYSSPNEPCNSAPRAEERPHA
jgi:hypothetical protein